MQMRQAVASDLRSLAELWAQAFPSDRSVAERVRQIEAGVPYGGLDCTWLAEVQGRLAGAFRAYRLTEHLDGAALPMLGLAAVATASTARRRGVGRSLCRHALRIGRERGDLISVLFPFRPAFYQALGWGLAGELHAYRFAPDALPPYDEAAAVRAAHDDDRTAIAACYARVAARTHGLIDRDATIWASHIDRPGAFTFVFDEDGIHGHAIVRFGRGRGPEAGTLRIDELVAEADAAYRGLLGWIAGQRDQVASVAYDARPDEHLDLRLSDPRPPGFGPVRGLWFPVARRIRGPMLRLLDVAAALEARTGWADRVAPEFTVEIEVDDPELPENRGPWLFTVGEGGARVVSRRAAGAARMATDAATFAQVYTGTLRPSVAARLGRAVVSGAVDDLDRAFAITPPFWLLDEF